MRVSRILMATQLWASHVTLTVMVLALFFQVLSRHFRWQVDWTEELARFAFIAMVFVAASYASQNFAHLRVTVFADMISRNALGKFLIDKTQLFAILLFDGLFCYYAFFNFMEGFRWPNISPSLGFNENMLFLAPVIGFAAAILHRILSLFGSTQQATPGDAGQ